MGYMFAPFKKYATFTGRARRSEMWQFFLLYIVLYLGTFALAMASGGSRGGSPLMALRMLVALGFFLPLLAVEVRRLHDIDKSGWNILWSLVPIVGFFIVLYFFVKSGTPGPNRFGEDPKGASAEVFA